MVLDWTQEFELSKEEADAIADPMFI